jgi:hypothetical protein
LARRGLSAIFEGARPLCDRAALESANGMTGLLRNPRLCFNDFESRAGAFEDNEDNCVVNFRDWSRCLRHCADINQPSG